MVKKNDINKLKNEFAEADKNKEKKQEKKEDRKEEKRKKKKKKTYKKGFVLTKESIDKIQLMKSIDDDKNITNSGLVEEALDLLWREKYKQEYLSLLKTMED